MGLKLAILIFMAQGNEGFVDGKERVPRWRRQSLKEFLEKFWKALRLDVHSGNGRSQQVPAVSSSGSRKAVQRYL